jgi:KDO2-lipid IV(A) lauroyltransferase
MPIGDRLAWLVADLVTRFKPRIFDVVQANLSQVLGPSAEGKTLEQVARQVFYTTLRSNYDLFRALRMPREKLLNLVEFPEEAREVVRSLWDREGGSVVVFPHLGNFDLGGQAIAAFLRDPQVLTLPDPPPGFELLNKLRQLTDVEVTPLSSAALRQAVKRLRRGGIVSIAGDRPVSELDDLVSFFGSPARVPSGHVRLALRTDAVIVPAYCILSPDRRRYSMHFQEPMEMIRTGNRERDVQMNMRNVLDALEAIIRQWPEQWQMYVPVWPKLLEA